MSTTGPPRRELSCWKEIADYLGVSVRTAQHWETERRLPVRRFSGEKGRVGADPAELDRWRQATHAKPRWWSGPRFLRLWAGGATAVLLIAGAGYLLSTRKGPPARFHHEFESLVVTDEQRRELWHKTFPETFDRLTTPEGLLAYHKAWFGDLDGDGRVELLYTYSPASVETTGETLFCFSHDGREKWRFAPGGTVATRQGAFPRSYNGIAFRLLPPERDGTRRIVLTVHHSPRFPNQVAVLSHQGAVLGEYWHSGHLGLMELADLDGDGKPEILMAGISNGYKAATLLVLDPSNLGGASQEENLDYQLQGLGPGREKARILFPRTCINRKFHEYGVAGRLAVHGDSIEVAVSEGTTVRGEWNLLVFYGLNRKLELADVVVNDPLKAAHRELEAAGQLDHSLTDKEISELRHLRYLKRLGD